MNRHASYILSDDINMVISFNSIQQYNNIFMVHSLQKFDLPPYTFLPLVIFDLNFLVNFNSHLPIRWLVQSYPYRRISSLSYLFSYQIFLLEFLGFVLFILAT